MLAYLVSAEVKLSEAYAITFEPWSKAAPGLPVMHLPEEPLVSLDQSTAG